jgi:hypothetical protein
VDMNKWYMLLTWLNLSCTLIGKDVRECSDDLNWSAMWTEEDVGGWFYDQYELVCGLEQMI